MRKLNKAEILQIQDGQRFHVRLTRLYYPAPHRVYEGVAPLYVLPAVRGRGWAVLTPQNPAPAWAEYTPGDIEPDGSCVAEDYLMEIFAE